jgi:hypothetical protein
MKINTKIIIEFKMHEATALKKLLGSHSSEDYCDQHKLTSEQIEVMRRLYYRLPEVEADND